MDLNPTKEDVEDRTRTTNYEGGEAFEPDSPQLALYKVVINNLLEDTFYREDQDALKEVITRVQPVAEEDPEFVLQLAAYAREEMYLRDISQVLLVLAAAKEATKPYVREYAPAIIQRADEPMTVIAAWDQLLGGTLPKPLKKGIADALHNFDAYQFAKYDSDRREVNLKDVLNRTHPKPEDFQEQAIFQSIIHGELDEGEAWKDHYTIGEQETRAARRDVSYLDTPETWETTISERGNTKEAWLDVLPKMGLFAIIRNLRNLIEAGVGADTILEELDLEWVRNAKLYPFRFYQSYQALQDAGVARPDLQRWLSDAVDVAAESLPDQLESTFVTVDLSGSMDSRLSERSTLTYKEIAALFGGTLMRKGAATSGFGEDHQVVSAHVDTPTLELQRRIMDLDVGHSTNAWKALRYLTENDERYDRVVIFTDEQVWDSTGYRQTETVRDWLDAYREHVHPEAALYVIDLSSYGTLSTPEGYPGVYRISGWNENVIDFIQYAERPDAVISEIGALSP